MPPWNGGKTLCSGARYRCNNASSAASVPSSEGIPFGRAPADPLEVETPRDEREHGIAAEEREAPPAFGVLNRLEQKALALPHELGECRQRRLEVGEHLAPNRHDGVIARLLLEDLEARTEGHTGPGVDPSPKARKKQLRAPVWQAPRPSCSTTNSNTSMSQS